MTDDIHPLHAKEHQFRKELESGGLSQTRTYFIYGYLNASRGRMNYHSNFFGENYRDATTAKDPDLLKSFLNGIRESASDNVAMYGGMSDAYKLVSSDEVSGVSTIKVADAFDKEKERHLSYRELVTQAFFDGISDGFRRIGEKDVISGTDAGAFILAAGEQSRREAAIMGRIPYGMSWPVIPVAYYQRVKDALAKEPDAKRRYTQFWELIESFPHNGETAEYEAILNNDDIRYLVSCAYNIGQLDVIQMRLGQHFNPERIENISLLRQKTRDLATTMLTSGNNIEYSQYVRGISFNYIPSGIVGQEFQNIERQFNAKAKEVERRKTDGRLIVVFNSATGLCVVERTASDLKQGISFTVVARQETLPDLYLPPKAELEMPEGGTPEQEEEFLQLRERFHADAVQKRHVMFRKMRESLPEIRNVIQSMALDT